MQTPWKMAKALAVLGAVMLTGCSSDPSGPAVGHLTGTVNVVGDLLPDGDGTGEIVLLRHPDAPRSEAVRRMALQGGPRTYTFVIGDLPAGSYYAEACLRFAAGMGCGPYTRVPGGEPVMIVVRSGRTTEVQISF